MHNHDKQKKPPLASHSALIFLSISILVILADIATKQVAEYYLTYGIPVYVNPLLDMLLQYNTGAAFSFLADAGGWQRWFFTIVTILVSGFILIWMRQTPSNQIWLSIALSCVLGGAIGNLIDRIMYGHVIDFISVHHEIFQFFLGSTRFPAFNVADMSISCGACMLLIDAIKDSFTKEKNV
jgi:signal peptidase II